MKKEYLSEEKYQNVKRILIIIGCFSLLVGIALLVSLLFAQMPDIRDNGYMEAIKLQNLLRFLSFPFLLMIPLVTFVTAFQRGFNAFAVQQTMPIAKEGIEKMALAIGTLGKEISKGIKEEDTKNAE